MGAGVRGRESIFGNFEDLAFDDAADLVQGGGALAVNFRVVRRLAPQPDNDANCGHDDEAGNRQQFAPIRKKVFQRPPLRAPMGSEISPSVSRAFSQSFRNDSRPRSVSGCLKSISKTLNGIVPICAPIFAASTTCIGWRRLAASTRVL